MSSIPSDTLGGSDPSLDPETAEAGDLETLERLSAALAAAEAAKEVCRAFASFIGHFGFTTAAVLSVPVAVVGSFHAAAMCAEPSEYWVHAFPKRSRRRHPLVDGLGRLNRPVIWERDRLKRLSLAAGCRRADELVRRHDICAAVAVPVLARANHIDVVALTTPCAPVHIDALDLVATGSKAAFAQWTIQTSAQITPAISLTSREAEITRWMAAGKSDWEIGQILRISSKTVNFHAENIKRKCGVATRVQAVVALLGGADLLP
jgi:DNA-binding CsgD family transcriptional regulator